MDCDFSLAAGCWHPKWLLTVSFNFHKFHGLTYCVNILCLFPADIDLPLSYVSYFFYTLPKSSMLKIVYQRDCMCFFLLFFLVLLMRWHFLVAKPIDRINLPAFYQNAVTFWGWVIINVYWTSSRWQQVKHGSSCILSLVPIRRDVSVEACRSCLSGSWRSTSTQIIATLFNEKNILGAFTHSSYIENGSLSSVLCRRTLFIWSYEKK